MTRALGVLAAISLALLIAGCTDDADDQSRRRPSTPARSTRRCNGTTARPDIEAGFLSEHRCGTLVVPQDRDDAGAGTLDLAVIQVWPVGVEPRAGLVTGFAANTGDPRHFDGGMASGATRLRSIVVELAFRGTNPSSPALTCPEVDALADRAPGLPDDDEGLRRDFLQAVSDCAARLRGDGIEPAELRHHRCSRGSRGPPCGHGSGLVVGGRVLRHPVPSAVSAT